MKPIEDFLNQGLPNNAYIELDGWDDFYVRKGDIGACFGGKSYRVKKCFTMARIIASEPGSGAFTRVLEWLVAQGWAIYVECVHNPRFADKLRRMGFHEFPSDGAPSFIFNYEGHLQEWR